MASTKNRKPGGLSGRKLISRSEMATLPRLQTPNASARLITIRMRTRHLIVGDDLVVPINDVNAAVGAVGEGDGAEEGIVAGDEVGKLGEAPAESTVALLLSKRSGRRGGGVGWRIR